MISCVGVAYIQQAIELSLFALWAGKIEISMRCVLICF